MFSSPQGGISPYKREITPRKYSQDQTGREDERKGAKKRKKQGKAKQQAPPRAGRDLPQSSRNPRYGCSCPPHPPRLTLSPNPTLPHPNTQSIPILLIRRTPPTTSLMCTHPSPTPRLLTLTSQKPIAPACHGTRRVGRVVVASAFGDFATGDDAGCCPAGGTEGGGLDDCEACCRALGGGVDGLSGLEADCGRGLGGTFVVIGFVAEFVGVLGCCLGLILTR